MPTAPSWTEPTARWAEGRRAAGDARLLLGFRLAGLRGRARFAAPVSLAVMGVVTVLAAVVPALVPEQDLSRHDALLLLPSAFLSVLVVSVVSAASSGGGRELLPRDQAVAFPVSPATDHLGALLMVPLNIAWLLQAWTVVGATSYAVGAGDALLPALVPVLLWLVAATAVAQALAWSIEWVRRGRGGRIVVRAGSLALAVVAGVLVATDRLTAVLDRSPTVRVAVAVLDARDGRWAAWTGALLGLVVLTAVAVAGGALLADRVARRPTRDESRAETARRAARPNPASDLLAVLRTDRAGVWRSVPLRRGMIVLALLPGLIAVSGSFRWSTLGIFPGLVASGVALLFGVNAWCLDGRGALWRETLPVSPRLAFWSRVLVLGEILVSGVVVTLLLATLRAGLPSPSQLSALASATVVVTVQVVATAMRWSLRHPYVVNLRSARATPAPPMVMVGYSLRLALTTTTTGMLLGAMAALPWYAAPVAALPFLAWSTVKLALVARAWTDPVTRCRVVSTVAG